MVRHALAAMLLCLSATVAAQVRIGFVATMSGPAGAIGQDQYDGFLLALEQRGGKLGGAPVVVLREDDQLRPDVGLQVVDKLIERERIDLLTGLTFSNVIMAVHKRVVDSRIPFVGSNGGPSQIAGEQCSPYFVSTAFQNDGPHEAMGRFAAVKGYQRVALMAPNYQAGKDAIAGFKRFYKGEVVDETYTTLNQADYATEMTQVVAKRPDAIYVFYPGGMGINFLRQYSLAGYNGKIPLLSAFTVEGTTLPAMKDAAFGVMTGAHWAPELDTPVNKAFVAAFEGKHKRTPSLYAAQGYDSALLIDAALARVGGGVQDRQTLARALRESRVDGTRGPLLIGANGFPVQDYYAWEIVEGPDGKPAHALRLKALPNHRDAYVGACKP